MLGRQTMLDTLVASATDDELRYIIAKVGTDRVFAALREVSDLGGKELVARNPELRPRRGRMHRGD